MLLFHLQRISLEEDRSYTRHGASFSHPCTTSCIDLIGSVWKWSLLRLILVISDTVSGQIAITQRAEPGSRLLKGPSQDHDYSKGLVRVTITQKAEPGSRLLKGPSEGHDYSKGRTRVTITERAEPGSRLLKGPSQDRDYSKGRARVTITQRAEPGSRLLKGA